jgi:nucleoside-diphosphate-sugar epimerase
MGKIKVAVTGAAGQVGSVLVSRMLQVPDIDPVAICRNVISGGVVHSSAPGCDIRIGSITESESPKKMIGDCEVIVNCALAMISGQPRESRFLNKAMIDNFSHIKKLKTLIHLSSLTVYGGSIDSSRSRRNTFENPRPDNDYGKSKLYIERYAKRMCISRQLNHYLLRIGHVIGANMDRSRQLIEYAQDLNFSLPFSGELPSNTIHVEHLAAMIISLISSTVPSGTYNVADKDKTWRSVLDWHTQSLGIPPVKGMTPDRSNHLKALYRKQSILRDIVSWLGSLSILNLIKYPAIFEFAYSLLATTPTPIATHIKTTYKCKYVRRQIEAITYQSNEMIRPYFFSDAMPGTYLDLPLERSPEYPTEEELSKQLRDWFLMFSQPRPFSNPVSENLNNTMLSNTSNVGPMAIR